MRIGRATFPILSVLCFVATGCSDRRALEDGNMKPSDMKDLQAEIAMTLPSDAVLLNSSDGGRYDPNHGFYCWTLFSPSTIKMPKRKTGVKDHLDLSSPGDLQDTVAFVEVEMRGRRISKPEAAFGSEWENDHYTFRGTLVQSSDGDYLVVERFRKK